MARFKLFRRRRVSWGTITGSTAAKRRVKKALGLPSARPLSNAKHKAKAKLKRNFWKMFGL